MRLKPAFACMAWTVVTHILACNRLFVGPVAIPFFLAACTTSLHTDNQAVKADPSTIACSLLTALAAFRLCYLGLVPWNEMGLAAAGLAVFLANAPEPKGPPDPRAVFNAALGGAAGVLGCLPAALAHRDATPLILAASLGVMLGATLHARRRHGGWPALDQMLAWSAASMAGLFWCDLHIPSTVGEALAIAILGCSALPLAVPVSVWIFDTDFCHKLDRRELQVAHPR